MNYRKFAAGFLTLAVLAATSGHAQAFGTRSERDVVTSSDGVVVTNSFGNCVRTRWDAGTDECNPPQPAAAVEEHKHYAGALGKEDRTVYFAFNQADLTPEGKAKLDTLANVLTASDNVTAAHVAGYADRIGSVSYNDKLSQRRAETVKNYIVGRGFVNTDVTETRWLGKSEPITSCARNLSHSHLVQCLQKDRRVEVEIDYKPQTQAWEQR